MRQVRHIVSFLTLALAMLAGSAVSFADDLVSTAARRDASLLQPDHPSLFGTREIFSRDSSAFFKWNGVLARFRAEQRSAAVDCAPRSSGVCAPAVWRALVEELRPLDLRAKVERVNAEINRHPYVPSMRNWGESNHWETPFEFFRKSGQCQDYAVTKYLLLRAAGVPADRLRVVVLYDTRLGLDHAVTVAYVDHQALMLDNQIPDVVPVESIDHYQPYYSINEQGWWLHRGDHARYAQVPRRVAIN